MLNELLVKARQANEVWLSGWGCELEHLDFCVVVRNTEIADYNGIYDIRSPADVTAALNLARSITIQSGHPPTLFLPNSTDFRDAARNWRSAAMCPGFGARQW